MVIFFFTSVLNCEVWRGWLRLGWFGEALLGENGLERLAKKCMDCKKNMLAAYTLFGRLGDDGRGWMRLAVVELCWEKS